MPPEQREKKLRQRVVAHYMVSNLRRLAAWNMDMLARLSLLEGAAPRCLGEAAGPRFRQRFGPLRSRSRRILDYA
jgi:hypothetical protein